MSDDRKADLWTSWLTSKEAAQALGCSLSGTIKWIRRYPGAIKRGGAWFVPTGFVDWYKAQRHTAGRPKIIKGGKDENRYYGHNRMEDRGEG